MNAFSWVFGGVFLSPLLHISLWRRVGYNKNRRIVNAFLTGPLMLRIPYLSWFGINLIFCSERSYCDSLTIFWEGLPVIRHSIVSCRRRLDSITNPMILVENELNEARLRHRSSRLRRRHQRRVFARDDLISPRKIHAFRFPMFVLSGLSCGVLLPSSAARCSASSLRSHWRYRETPVIGLGT